MAWTTFILFRQKQVWGDFAARNKLRFRSDSLLSPPEMDGVYDGYSISLFGSEHGDEFANNSRKLTAIELRLQSQMPFEGGAASGNMVKVLQTVEFREEWVPEHEQWNKEWILMGDSRSALASFFTPERLGALASLMKMKNVWVIFVFRGDINLLRIDTPYPLDNPKKLDAIIKKMIGIARILEMKEGESAKIKVDMVRKPVKEVALEMKENAEAMTFELEDDPAPETTAQPEAEPAVPEEDSKS